MKPFLKQVAEAYARNESDNLIDYCFVFPNKRSTAFFKKFIDEALPSPHFLPEITTISRFVAELSPLTDASRYEQLFILYNEYRKLSADISDFDQFLFWGEMLINDFNDVDMYLVDPEALFVNVKRLREINSNYLTPEQLEIIRRYWGDERPAEYVNQFWSHIHYETESHPTQNKFLKLWEVLLPLFNGFKSALRRERLSTKGMFYRNAVDRLSPIADTKLPYKRYIFVGFNVLSTSELKIFSYLRDRDAADFYWDFNSPAFDNDFNKATRFIRQNAQEFKSRYRLEEPQIDEFPNINIVGVPSNTGQVKYAGKALSSFIENGDITDPGNAINTAIVLPDESLFIPMIHSVPDEIESINVTMGFPMRFTPVSALMRNIISMQLRARTIRGIRTFFYEDVRKVLSNPIIRSISPADCDDMLSEIMTHRMFNVPCTFFTEKHTTMSRVFRPVKNHSDIDHVFGFVNDLIDFLSERVTDDPMQQHFLSAYRDALQALYGTCKRFSITMRESTMFHLLQRAINSDTVNFVGEPLKGLQIMGVLETRALDFDNVIMMSMNERVFPRKHYTGSFIPEALRRGYGMSTVDFQESIFAYYFYRLISRAKNVTLIYDARTIGGVKTGEMSRYPLQLLYLFGRKRIKHSLSVFKFQSFNEKHIEIAKTPEIMERLNAFTNPESGKHLSASAINNYINCPFQFYLEYVENFRTDNELTDYMDSSTYGSIVHEVAQNFYLNLKGNASEVKITDELLDHYINNDNIFIDKLITYSINLNYNRLGHRNPTPLIGEALVLSKIIKATIRKMLECEKAFTPFYFIDAEHKMKLSVKINDKLSVNFTQIIDRIDRTEQTLRIVDYKTGIDPTVASSISSAFDPLNEKREKALVQLMTYCYLYGLETNPDTPIQPLIYKMGSLAADGIKPYKVDKEYLLDYHTHIDEFINAFKTTVEQMFNPDIPFKQSPSAHHCKYCNFKSICGRTADDE